MKQQKTILNTAIYARVSTDIQAKKGDSVDEQIDTLNNYVSSHDNLILFDTYIDDGVSGQKIKRGDFARLMEDVRTGHIDLIIFTKLDRWFRSLRHYLNTQDILEAHQCAWLAVDQPYFDTSTPHGRAFVAQSMTFAELEAANDSTRILDVFDFKYKRGEVLSGRTPLGYSIVDKHLQPNEDAVKVQKLFEYYASTSSLVKTTKYAENDLGIVRTEVGIRRILRTEKYIGVFRDNKKYCPPIISKELFDIVQYLLSSKNIKNNKKYDYVFTGMLRCMDCNHSINGFPQRSNRKPDGSYRIYLGYRCRQAYPLKRCSNKKIFYETTLEKYLIENVQDLLRDYIVDYELKAAKVIDYSSRRAALQKKINRLKDLYVNELITLDEMKIDKARYMQEISELPTSNEPVRDFSAARRFLEMDLKDIYYSLSQLERQRLWRSIIREIRVDHDKNIEVVFL